MIPSIAGIIMSKVEYSVWAGVQAGIIGLLGIVQLGLFKLIYQQSGGLSIEKHCIERKPFSARLEHLLKGSRQFFSHKICLPGISLAMLYLTVMGLDSITIRYILLILEFD